MTETRKSLRDKAEQGWDRPGTTRWSLASHTPFRGWVQDRGWDRLLTRTRHHDA